jgi:GTPase SAR1 family protein
MSGDSKFLMLGLRGSGKTTFLAALWHFIESGEIDDRLSIPSLQPDRDYLNNARNSWLALKPVGRTSMRSTNNVSLTLVDKKLNAKIDMSLPDLSGESFRLQWVTRKAPKTYVEFAQGCDGVFLFVHPNEVARTHVIKPLTVEQQPIEDEETGSAIPASANWTPAQSSTQVQLVDVLQLLMRMREKEAKMRVAVIVSAWDVIRAKIPPAVWLERRLPLLSQLIRANPDRMASDVFGVSAQGGDLTADRASLLRASVPSSRCYAVQGSSLDKTSIAAPLQFLLDDREPMSS